MKKTICLQLTVLLLLVVVCFSCSQDKAQVLSQNNKIVFNSTPELYKLTSEWAACFSTLNPGVEIEVMETTESGLKNKLDGTAQLSFVTGDFEPEIYKRSLWKVTVGRNVIVPVINARNPFVQEIYKQGISPAGLARILNSPENTPWNLLIENGPDVPVSLFTTSDLNLHAGIARFLGRDQVSFSDKLTQDPEALLASLQSNAYAMGISYLVDMIDPRSMKLYEDIRILPIDKNGNGLIDYKEDVYASLDVFARGVWIGKYPKSLSSTIYSVASTPPASETEQAFLSWVISQGHVLLDNHGFGDLSEFERLAQVKIIDGIGEGQPSGGTYTLPKEPGFFKNPLPYVLSILFLLTLLLFTMFLFFSPRRRKRISETLPVQESVPEGFAISENHVEVSPGLYYDKTHTWAFMEKDGTVKVGIDDFLQRVTGPLTRVKMKFPGERLKKGKKAVSIIQDGKQLDISAPVSGTIKEQNSLIGADASLLNSSPHSEGWIYKIEPSNWIKEVQFLIMGKSYRQWLRHEFRRLKDFLADVLKTENSSLAQVLQDGGEVKENILEDLGPETWEDFQTHFMDVSS